MTPAAAPVSRITRAAEVRPGTQEGLRFGFHLVLLAALYAAIVVAWGHRNAWPDDLLACVLATPVSFLVCQRILADIGCGLGTDVRGGQPEQLIAALVLAVGVASGQMLLMSGGLVCLGIGWLRPSKPDVDWAEWLKAPFLLLGILPIWLDLDGGRIAIAPILDDPLANPTYRLPLGLALTQAHVLTYAGLIALALMLRGRDFWLALPLLPAFMAAITLIPRFVPEWASLPPLARLWSPWVAGAALIALLDRFARHFRAKRSPLPRASTIRRWFAERRHPPWIAVLVVGIAQAGPLQSPRSTLIDLPSLGGLALLFGLLLILRVRTVRGPIHSRSTAAVAGALALTLLGEFTATDSLRRIALGLVILGLLSWHCFWNLRILFAALIALAALLGPSPDTTLPGLPPGLFDTVRLAVAGVAILALARFITLPLPPAGAAGYDDVGWVPAKRFALVLMGLMLLFQLASAFWPDHEMEVPGLAPAPATAMATAAESAETADPLLATRSPVDGVDLFVTHPRHIPHLVESPSAAFQRRGWQVSAVRRIPHPRGEAGGAVATRQSARVGLLWWFEHDGRAFANHRYARRILWSSWHLANRDLRLVTLQSSVLADPLQLAEHARLGGWFTNRTTRPTDLSR